VGAAADHRVDFGDDFRANVELRLGILLVPVSYDGVDVGLRLLNREVRFQPRNALEELVVALLGHRFRAVLRRFAQVRHRYPKFRRTRKSNWIREPRRHHANHLKLFAIERDILADHAAFSTELALPQAVAQNHDAISGFVFVRQKCPAQHRLNTQQLKQIRGNRFALNVRRLVSIRQRANGLIGINRDTIKDLSLVAEINVIEIRDRLDLSSRVSFLPRIELTERDEILRFMEWKRPQQHRVQDAKDRGVGANSECKSQNDNGGKERLLAKNAKSVSEILHKLFGSQGDDWIDARSAARGNPRSEEGRSKK